MTTNETDRLDAWVEKLQANPNDGSWGVLSTSEQMFVLLAANRPDLLGRSIADAIDRIGPKWALELAQKWGR